MRLLPIAAAALLLGCGSLVGPDEERRVGIVPGLHPGASTIVIPESVQAGAEFTVTIETGWPNTCARKSDTQVRVQGLDATITPYDIVTEGSMCGQMPQRFTHTATLRFAEPGTARIVVRGRASHDSGVLTVERSVTVR